MNERIIVATPPLDDGCLVSAPEARKNWPGDISEATEWRWQNGQNAPAGFPKPIKINRLKFYRVGDLRKFTKGLAETDV